MFLFWLCTGICFLIEKAFCECFDGWGGIHCDTCFGRILLDQANGKLVVKLLEIISNNQTW